MASRKRVSVVIPSWNSEAQLKDNLPAVFIAASAVGAEIIIVDDASTDDQSVNYLKSLGDKIKLLENKVNSGFAATVNYGVRQARSDIILLLNTDVRPAPDCFLNCLKQFTDPLLFAVTFNSHESWAGARWQGGLLQHARVEPTTLNKNKENPSLWASGGQAAFDRQKWIELGGMDTLYEPFYWEDVDLGYRAWKNGWHIIWDPTSRCVHDHKRSVIASTFSRKHIQNIAQRNQLLFVWKNITDKDLLSSHLLHLPRLLKNYPSAFCAALLRLPRALIARAREKKHRVLTDRQVLAHWS